MYIFNHNIKNNQSLYVSLQKVIGIGEHTSSVVCTTFGIGRNYAINNISLKSLNDILNFVNTKLIVGNNLLKYYYINLKRYIDIKNYRGLRHRMGYTVHGQRTHTNGKTQKRLYKRIYMFKYK